MSHFDNTQAQFESLAAAAPSAPVGAARSIDTKEFRDLLLDYSFGNYEDDTDGAIALIAHIDQHVASQVRAALEAAENICAGKDSRYSPMTPCDCADAIRAFGERLAISHSGEGAAPAMLDADEMTRLRRLMKALGHADAFEQPDDYVRGVMCTVLGEAAGRIERAAPAPTVPADQFAQFKAWAQSHGGLPLDSVDDSLATDDGLALPTFRHGRTEIAWRAWHAAIRAHQPAQEQANTASQVDPSMALPSRRPE